MGAEFGPESTNPRQRRAFAHAIISKAKSGEATVAEARTATEQATSSKKGRESGLGRAIFNMTTTLWESTEQGMQLLEPDTDLSRWVKDGIVEGQITPAPGSSHRMRLGSILVARENTFAFHPSDITQPTAPSIAV